MMNKEEIFLYEKEKLEKAISMINERIEIAKSNFEKQKNFIIGFKEGQRGTQFTRQSLMSLYATEISNLELVVDNPYFGMFEFKDNQKDKVEQIYIGKNTISDKNSKIISYDWRSPICSMYYDYNIGDAKYTLNGDDILGEILKKRQLIIKKGNLIDAQEQDTLSDDRVLIKYLSENGDSRLKSIIATISREQNSIIRNPLRQNYILQGVAGSGKTTVALHRIAYLVYTEAKNINEGKFVILGPNKYFLNYISDLLPNLDIKNISQTTFEQLALDNIKDKLKLINKNTTLKNVLSKNVDPKIFEYKSSVEYMKLIESFLEMYVKKHLEKDIVYENIKLCSSEDLKTIYARNSFNSKIGYLSKSNNFMKTLINKIKVNSEEIYNKVWLDRREEFLALDQDDPRRQEIIDETNMIKNEIKKGCPSCIKEYFKFLKVSPLNLYTSFIENLDFINKDKAIGLDIKELQEYTLAKLKKKQIESDDLTPLLLISCLMNGRNNKNNEFSHIVIDEAQDLSLAQYYILKYIFPGANFDLFGDVNQSIYDYQSVQNWNSLNDIIFNSNAQMLNLDKSYRTTQKIFNASNLILESMNHDKCTSIAREGIDIEVKENSSKDSILYIINKLNLFLKKNYNTIAIICKDDQETDKVYDELKKRGVHVNKISENDEVYSGGVCVIPSYLSKGLEFDAVILYNANDVNYSNSKIDMKLLYVAITRAMHELAINYEDKLTNVLTPLLETKSNNDIKTLSLEKKKLIN